MSLFQSNLRKQIRNLPKILNFAKIIHYYSKFFTGVLRHLSSGYKEWRAVLGRHDGVLYKLVCDRGLRRAFLYKVEEDPYDEHDLRPSARDREADLAAMKALLPLLPPAFRKVCAPKINAKSDFV